MNQITSAETIVHIYALFDPREPEHIRYVGKTQELKKRIKCHITKSLNENTYKACWIKKLFNNGLEPSYKILEECNSQAWSDREIFWIKYYKEEGHKLTNLTDGGEINIPSEETKKKISEKLKGKCYRTEEGTKRLIDSLKKRVYTDEIRKNMSLAHTGKSTMTDEGRKKISISNKTRIISDETKLRHSLANRAAAKKYDFNGEMLSITEASEKYSINNMTLRARMEKGVSPSIALLSKREIKDYLAQYPKIKK